MLQRKLSFRNRFKNHRRLLFKKVGKRKRTDGSIHCLSDLDYKTPGKIVIQAEINKRKAAQKSQIKI